MGKVWMPGGGGGTDLDMVTAGKPDVLAGKVIVDKDGEPLTGTMPNNGAVSQALNAGGSYTVPAGYHNGSGKVTANSLASQTSATAIPAQVLIGQTAWVNGSKITGTMPDKTQVDSSIGGINSSYPNVAVQKGTTVQMTNTTISHEVLLAMSPPSGYYQQGTTYVACTQSAVASAVGISSSNIRSGTSILGVSGSMVDYSYLNNGQVAF